MENWEARYGQTSAAVPRVCHHGGSLSLKPNEQIAWRFIRNDIVLWMRRVWLLHYPSVTNDVLQINYQAATSSCWEADLVDESENSPMAIPAYTAPSFQYNSQSLSLYEVTHINTITSWGWCVCTDRKEQTHNLSTDMGWKGPLLCISAWRWSQKATLTPRSWCASSLACTSPVQTAPGFIPHWQW